MADQPRPVPYAFLPGHPDWLRTFVYAQSFAPRGGLNGGRRPLPRPRPAPAPSAPEPPEAEG